MMKNLSEAQNIGKVLEVKLNKIGIHSIDELKRMGAEAAFAQIKAIEPNAARSVLFSLDGAISGVRWHSLNESRKNELRNFFNELEQRN
jgi:DNA transformation protein and related proteins